MDQNNAGTLPVVALLPGDHTEDNGTVLSSPSPTGKLKKNRNIDTGWAWVVLFASFMVHLIVFGITLSIGIFYSELLDAFDRGPVATSWLIATHCALGALAGPIGSILANKFGFTPVIALGATISALGFFISYFVYEFWTLFLSFGIMTGLGLGIVYAPSFGILALYFDKRKTFATAAVTVGIGVGTFLIPPLERLLIGSFTWRGASLILAGVNLNIIPCALLLTSPVVPQTSRSVKSFSQSADVSLFKKSSFYVMISHFFLMGSFNMFVIIGIRFVTDTYGISKDDAPLLISAQGLLNIFGRLSAVLISSNRWTSSQTIRFAIFHAATVMGGLTIMLYSLTPTFLGLCFCSGGIGYFMGLRYALLPAIQIEIFSPQRFSTSWSYGMFLLGVGSLVLPPLGEWVSEVSGNVQAPFYLAGGSILLACSCTFVLQYCLPSFKTENEKSSEEFQFQAKEI